MKTRQLRNVTTRLPLVIVLPFLAWAPLDAQSAESAKEKTMAPTQVLREEHHLIEEMALYAGTTATRIRGGEKVDLEELDQLHDFFKHFADECHHAKEEEFLFPTLMKLEVDTVVTDLLVKQHEEGRILLGGIAGILGRTEATPSTADRNALAEYLSQYSKLMERHIKLENDYLWPKVSHTLDNDSKDEMAGDFHRLELGLGEGFHERYHTMAMGILSGSVDE